MKHGFGRKLLSIVLAVMMLVSLLPTAAFAEELSSYSAENIVVNDAADDSTTGNDTEPADEDPVDVVDTYEGESEETTTPVSAAVAKIGDKGYATLAEAIETVQNGETIVVSAGEYTLPSSFTLYVDKAFTIEAAEGADVSFDMTDAVTLGSAKVTFNRVTFNYKTNGNYKGLQHADTLVYNDCVIKGMVFLYATNETFNNCTFNQDSTEVYNLWTYGAKNVEFNGCTFKCAGKAVHAYQEGDNAGGIAQTIVVKDCNVKSSAANKAFLNIKNTQRAYDVVLEGTNAVEGLNADKTTDSNLYQVETTEVTETSGKPVTVKEKAADGTVKTVYEVKAESTAVAKIGDTGYTTLDAAFAVLAAVDTDTLLGDANYTLTLENDSVWNAATPVYWAAGERNGYAATLAAALTAAYKANAGKITIVCRPGADVGKMTHGHVADNITIFGNNAYISSGECDLEVDTFKFSRTTGAQANDGTTLDKDITVTGYQLDNLGVWGQRTTNRKVTVALIDCDGKAIEGQTDLQRVYISGTTGTNNIVLKDCDFLTKATAVYSNADGSIAIMGCSFVGGQAPVNVNHKADGEMTVAVQGCTFTNCGDNGEWKNFAAPVRFVNSGSGTMTTTVDSTTFTNTVGSNGDILLGDGRTGQKSNNVSLNVSKTNASIQAQKPGYYNGTATDATKMAKKDVKSSDTLTTSVDTLLPAETAGNGTKDNPYTLAQLGAMTRRDYIDAQERLNGTMYVTVGNYSYDTNGVLGNGVRDDTTGQTPDHSKLNAYGENGYLGEKNDGANGKNVVFVGGSITSGVTGYASIDNIGTSLLLALPAYTNVTFKGVTFNNVMSFDYQLYTSPWSQLGELKFDGCTFKGIVVGAIAAQTLTFNSCKFENYTNQKSTNNSNPTWIRPAYGNWTKDDNEGQGDNFKSLTTINFTGNTVTSTRPVKFERIAQWEMDTTVTATGNSFDIKADGNKNVGMYFGANAKFDLVANNNTKSDNTAALYTAVYSAPDDNNYAGLPAGSTVTDGTGKVILEDAKEWKSTTKLTLESTTEVASVKNTKGTVNFATLQEAVNAAETGATVKLIENETTAATITVAAGKDFTLDLNGKTVTSSANGITVAAGAKLTVKDSGENGKIDATGNNSDGIENKGTLVIESGSFEAKYGAVRALGGSTTTINGGTFSSSENHYGMYYWANGTALMVTVNGGTFTHSVSTAMEKGKVTLSVNGGSFANDLSAYCPDGYATNYDESTELYVYGTVQVPAGYVEDANGNVTISDEDGLFWFAKQVNEKGNTFSGKTVKLAKDITLTKDWTPVGTGTMFQGTFDGAGHTISGVKCSRWYGYGLGFFANIAGAAIKDVTFVNADIAGHNAVNIVGVVAAYSYGDSTFENVHVKSSAVSGYGKVGGMVGMAADPGRSITFKNCSVSNTTIEGTYNTAGFCGLAQGSCSITGSYLANNTVELKEDLGASAFPGGFVDLDTTVTCSGGAASCPGAGTVIKGKYAADNECYYSAYSDLYNRYGADGHDCTLEGKTLKLANSEVVHDAPVEINGVKYSDLQTAFDAATTGDTVTLLTDTSSERINLENKSITVNLNGKTLTSTAAYGVMFCAKNGNTITIIGTTAGSKLVGTLMVTAETDGHIVINGGTYENAKYCPIYINGAVSTENSTLTVKDATITALPGDSNQDNGVAVYLAGYSTSAFTNTTITAPVTGLEIRAGKLTLTDCDVTGGNGEVVTKANGNGNTVLNAAVAISQHNTKKDIDVTITGGTYTATAAVYQTNVQGTGSENVKASITSGTFKGTVSAETNNTVAVSGGTFSSKVPANCCAEGYTPVQNSDGTYGVELANYVVVGGIKGFEDTKFASFADAYKAIKPVLETICEDALGEGTPANAAAFDAVFTDVKDGKATLTYTITGNVTYDETSYANLLTMGRRSSHYLDKERHLINFKFVGAEDNRGATLTVNSNITLPYEWWGEKLTTAISFENLTITGSAPNGLYTYQSFFEGIDFTLNNCTLKGIKIYNCANVGGSYTITNSTLDGTGASAGAYAIHLQGNETAPLSITISNNKISGYDKGINIDQKTAVATISGNTISIKDTNRSCIQLTQLAETTISGNTLNLNGGNAFTLHQQLAEDSKIDITENTIKNDGYLIYDNTKNDIALTYTDNTITGSVDTTKGVYNGETHALTDGVDAVINGVKVAQIGDVKYATLQAAIDAAKSNQSVRLLKDITLTDRVVVNDPSRSITLNLQGHSITAEGNALLNNGKLTIMSTGTAEAGKIVSKTGYAVGVGSGSTLTISSGTLEGREGAVITGTATGATITIKGGTFIATDNAVIAGNGSARDGEPNKITIKGGTFEGDIVTEGYIACGIYAPWKDIITVSGGTFNITNGAGIVARAGNVKVTGGTFICGDGQTTGWVGDNKNEVPNAALVFDAAANYPAKTDASQILVSGGTFSTDPSANGATLATGYVATKNDNGMYTVAHTPVAEVNGTQYGTLSGAIKAAVEKGGTVKLLDDINAPGTSYTIKGKVTIDLNGHKITGKGNNGVFYVYMEGDLTITGEGTVTAVENNKFAMAVHVDSAKAKVTLKGGTYKQQITNTADQHFDLIYAENGTVMIEGGKYECATPDWTLNCLDDNYKAGTANIIVTGGTFNQFNPADNTAEGANTNFVAAGYESKQDGDWYTVVVKADVVAVNDNTKTEYATLYQALMEAQSGDTVTLLKDTTEYAVIVRAGSTLDLNGNSVTGAQVVVANGQIIDTGDVKGIVQAEAYAMQSNKYTPVYDATRVGYSFFDLSVGAAVYDGVPGFWLTGANSEIKSAADLMLGNSTNRRVKAYITFTWDNGDGRTGEQKFTFSDSLLAGYLQYAAQNYWLFVNISGADALQSVSIQGTFEITDANGNLLYVLSSEPAPLK